MSDIANLMAAMMARQPVPPQWARDQSYIVPRGNINPYNRPLVRNPDGSTSTVRTMSYGNSAGQEVLIPTVSNEGTMMQPREAMRYWGQRGQDLGRFSSPDEATAYGQALHNQQASFYGLE